MFGDDIVRGLLLTVDVEPAHILCATDYPQDGRCFTLTPDLGECCPSFLAMDQQACLNNVLGLLSIRKSA